ncbi:hypothetical protein ACH61_03261 [Rathayibacter tanaceti]|uniref:Uncharacterized protein n=1 Tax=Rathayibacter tanaceti TaxID=1671680 RepID=A0A166GZA3_9MICO|nr:hypothetical protein ACH61_03261 [Rathayibacter tanaceti]
MAETGVQAHDLLGPGTFLRAEHPGGAGVSEQGVRDVAEDLHAAGGDRPECTPLDDREIEQ